MYDTTNPTLLNGDNAKDVNIKEIGMDDGNQRSDHAGGDGRTHGERTPRQDGRPDYGGDSYFSRRYGSMQDSSEPMTAAQHQQRMLMMELDEMRRELQACHARISELERGGNMQRGRSSTGRFTSGRGYGTGNIQHGGDYYPMYTGHYPGGDMDPYGYSEHEHMPGFAIHPRLWQFMQRAYEQIEPMIHRVEIDVRR